MRKQYSPVKIKNPSAYGLMVRLLQNQKLLLQFDNRNFDEHKIDVIGDFLAVEDVAHLSDGWVATICQNRPDSIENTLFLGSINLYDEANMRSGSVCVVSRNVNDDFLTVINPKNNTCNLELNQVLEVVFRTESLHQVYTPMIIAGDLCTEEIQRCSRPVDLDGVIMVEHLYRFRFDTQSIERFAERPTGKCDGGFIDFVGSSGDKSSIRLICSWRGRSSVYKALLMPRMPLSNPMFSHKQQKKQCMVTETTITPLEMESLDDGCNVLLSRVS